MVETCPGRCRWLARGVQRRPAAPIAGHGVPGFAAATGQVLGSPIAAEVIPQLAAAAAQIAAACEEPAPATITAAPTTRVKALDLLFKGSTVPASYDAPSYAVVMTGHFASYRGAGPRGQIKMPRRGQCLIVVFDATTLRGTDATLQDQDDTGLLAQLGQVTILTGETTRPSQNL
jgi:hypothetical protein